MHLFNSIFFVTCAYLFWRYVAWYEVLLVGSDCTYFVVPEWRCTHALAELTFL